MLASKRRPAKIERQLSAARNHSSFAFYLGGHPGQGAPSSATATVGTITAVYVQNRPTIRINTLNARFMGSFSFLRVPWERKPLRARNYKGAVKVFDNL